MEANKKIKVAVMGCGKMGHTDINDLLDSPYISEITGYDINHDRLMQTKAKFGIHVTDNADEIWKDDDIKLVYITTSPSITHVPLAVEALLTGKSVMTEKPSGVTYEQIDELIAVQKKTGGFLQVGLECRNYSRLFCRMKELVSAGEIGSLVNAHFTYSTPPYPHEGQRYKNSQAVNICLEKLCHYIDLVRWWNGSRVDRYMAVRANNVIPYYEIADNFHVTYSFENGLVSHLYFNMAAANGENYDLLDQKIDLLDQDKMGMKLNYVLVGTEGALECDVFQRRMTLFHHAGKKGCSCDEKIVLDETWDKKDDYIYSHNTRGQNLDIAMRVVLGEKPAIDLEDAMETMRLCLEFEEAAEKNDWMTHRR